MELWASTRTSTVPPREREERNGRGREAGTSVALPVLRRWLDVWHVQYNLNVITGIHNPASLASSMAEGGSAVLRRPG